MKKFTKTALVIAAIMGSIGLICLIACFAMGFTWKQFGNMVTSGKFNFGFDINLDEINIEEGKDGIAKVEEVCKDLDVELAAGTLEIYYDDVEEIEVQQEDVANFQCYMEDRTLHVKGGKNFGIGNSDGKITIVIPKDMKFEEVDMEVGAGEATVSGLTANTLDIEVGAGQADFTSLDVQNLNAETGAGELNVELIGSESDYNYDVECGIGEIEIGGNSYGGFGSEQNITNPGAERFLDLECGVGEVQVAFQK